MARGARAIRCLCRPTGGVQRRVLRGQRLHDGVHKTVLDEVCDLFPSDVIHIGGDEVPKVRWAQCPKCQAKMRRLGLEEEAALQTAFINEMGAHVARRGKRIMGWDEILEGGLPEGAIVQSWRGMEGAVEATHLGADAVVSPTSHCYLDYPLRSTDLREVYAFQPCRKRLWVSQAKSSVANATCGRSAHRKNRSWPRSCRGPQGWRRCCGRARQ